MRPAAAEDSSNSVRREGLNTGAETVFVLPAFNEQHAIVPLVGEILESFPAHCGRPFAAAVGVQAGETQAQGKCLKYWFKIEDPA